VQDFREQFRHGLNRGMQATPITAVNTARTAATAGSMFNVM